SGGLQFNVRFQGETRNKRLGLSVDASSYTLQGPIGGFRYVDIGAGNNFFGYVNNQLFLCFPCSNTAGVTIPHDIFTSGFTTNTTTIACCIPNFSADYTNQQRRSVNLLYNIAPTVQLILRYGLNNSISDYSSIPSLDTFSAPAGYAGKYPSGFQFYSTAGTAGSPSQSLDQTYEYDIRSRLGVGSLRASYL